MLRSDLWRICVRLGKVVDVFISNKKSRMGKRLELIRFVDVKDYDVMIRNLCDIWFGYHKLFAPTPRFSKTGDPPQHSQKFESNVDKIARPSASYASVVKEGLMDNLVFKKADDIIHLST